MSQTTQFAPLSPQALGLVPRLQLVPSQQPVAQLWPSQTHDPLTQRCPGAQAVSQEPQCWGLVCRSAHPSLQKTVAPGQPVQLPMRHWPPQH
jgi:hypothetical protein